MCLQIYQLDPAKFLSAPGLVWQAALKKSKVKLGLLTDINILWMVEKGITGEICHSIYRYAIANDKYMKDHDKNKELSYVQYWNINDLYAWAMSQKLPLNNFVWKKDNSQFNEDFICNYKEEGDEGFFFRLTINTLKNYMDFIIIYDFIRKNENWKFVKLVANLLDRTEYGIHIRKLKQILN